MYRSAVVRVAIAATVMALLGIFSVAQAADMPVKRQPSMLSPDPVSGWYGYLGTSIPLTQPSNDLKEDGCLYLCGGSSKLHADSAFGVVFGLGYRFSPYFRSDIRIGSGWSAISGKTNARNIFTGATVPGTTTEDISGLGGEVNGYLDLKPFFGAGLGNFEPYIGAGIGFARVAFTNNSFAAPGLAAIVTWPNVTDTRFGYSLTAGTGYRLNRNWLIDVAYIWRDFGTFRSGPIAPTSGVGATPPLTNFHGDLSGHAVDVGVRYEF